MDVATVSVLKMVPRLEAAAVEVTLPDQLPLEPSDDKSGVDWVVFCLFEGVKLGRAALNVLRALDIRDS